MPERENYLKFVSLPMFKSETGEFTSFSDIKSQGLQDENKLAEVSDEELVRLSLENRDYLVYLIKRYQEKLAKYINRISGFSQDDCEDILQEVFIKVYRNLNDFDRSLKFSSWIYRIARNQTISHYRKIKIRPDFQALGLDEQIANNLTADVDLHLDFDKDLNSKAVAEILETLEEKYREVLVLKFFEEKNYEEIADIIKKPMGTVATLISRAKIKFKAASLGKKYEAKY